MSTLQWPMGLKNAASQTYLTQETFGFAINCNGKSLKKKQSFTLVSTDGAVHLKTHLNKFMYGDKDGNVKGDAEQASAETEWTIVPQADGTWGLKSKYGFFFHGTGDKLSAFVGGDDVPADGRWVVHLAMHPQINLYNVMRKRFVHLDGDSLNCNEAVPWGDDALLSLIFFTEHPTGRYGIVACNGKYLENSGRLVDVPNSKCQFLLGFHDDQISLCDDEHNFLSCIGGQGVLKVARKDKMTKEELFKIQDSEPQFVIRNVFKDMNVSCRNGAEVKADQKVSDTQDTERFQFEVESGEIHIMSDKLKYWLPRDDGSIGVEADKPSAKTAFVLCYDSNLIRLQHKATGKFVIAKPNGAMFAVGDSSDAAGAFEIKIINRPTLILRGQYGFLGIKGASGRVECNRSQPEVFKLESKDGAYYLSSGGKYWTVDSDGVTATASAPVAFYLEFPEKSKALIKHADSGFYLQGEQNGGFKAKGTGQNIDTLWEF